MTKEQQRKLDDEAPVWAQVLRDITGGDEEYDAYLHRLVGYSLSGLTTEGEVYVCVGPKGSHKTLFAKTICMLLGDYAWYAPSSILLKPDRRLNGLRFLAVECNENTKLDPSYLRRLISGEGLKVGSLEFKSQVKLWLFCQKPPRALRSDPELLARVRILPFTAPKDRAAQLSKVAERLRNKNIFAPFVDHLE